MESEWKHTAGKEGEFMVEQYIGPSAARIANLIPHRVSFDKGWFWTTTAICHGGKSDALAFRQRADGNGIETRCHTVGCSRGLVITQLEALVGLPIWNAYVPVRDPAGKAPKQRRWPRRWLALAAVVALVSAAPLLLGLGAETAVLNLVGLGVGAVLVWRIVRRVKRWIRL